MNESCLRATLCRTLFLGVCYWWLVDKDVFSLYLFLSLSLSLFVTVVSVLTNTTILASPIRD